MSSADEEFQAVVTEVIEEEGATEIGGWHRVDPIRTDPIRARDDPLVQWADETEDLFVTVFVDQPTAASDRDEPRFNAWLDPAKDVEGVGRTSITTFGDNLENVLDTTITYLRTHAPNLPLGAATLRISGGTIIPLVDLLRRFAGGSTSNGLIEVRESELVVRGGAFGALVEVTIPATDMDAYTVEQEGQLAVDPGDLWDLAKQFNFGDTIAMKVGADNGRPSIEVGGVRRFQARPVMFTHRSMPAPFPADAELSLTGREFANAVQAIAVVADEVNEDAIAFGVADGVAIMVVEDESTGERVAARLDTISASGDAVVAVSESRLQELRKAMPRPASTTLSAVISEDIPLLFEYAVDGANASVRIALADATLIADFDLTPPIEEIEVSDEAEPAAEPEPEPPEPPEPEPPAPSEAGEEPGPLSRAEIETIAEQATVGVTAAAQKFGGELDELKLRPQDGAPVEFTTDVGTLLTTGRDTERDTIRAALETWAENIDPTSLTAAQIADINERREALAQQFDIDLPAFEPAGEPAEEEAPDAKPEPEAEPTPPRELGAGLTVEDVDAIIIQSVSGAAPADITVDEDLAQLRISWEVPPEDRRDVAFRRRLRDITGSPDNPVAVINDALAEWGDAVNMNTLTQDERQLLMQQRMALEEEFDIDLLGVEEGETAEPAEPEPTTGPDVSGVWADIVEMALDQTIPKEDREKRIAERLEERMMAEYPESFDDLMVALRFPEGGTNTGESLEETLDIEFGGIPSPAGEQRFIMPGPITILSSQGPVTDPEAVWEDMLDVIAIFDPEDDRFPGLAGSLATILSTTTFRIEEGLVDWDTVFLETDQIGEIVRRNPELWVGGVLTHMKDQSKAWWAAQRVIECQEGIQQVCDLIEREIAGTTPRGWAEWYLKNAYRIFLDGAFDPPTFVEAWHDVFRPGEPESEARDRRGPVDLDTLGRAGAQPEREEPTPPPDDDVEEEPAVAEEPAVDKEPAEGKSVGDFADDIRDRF